MPFNNKSGYLKEINSKDSDSDDNSLPMLASYDNSEDDNDHNNNGEQVRQLKCISEPLGSGKLY